MYHWEICILSTWTVWEVEFQPNFWCLTCKDLVMCIPFSTSKFIQASPVLSCSLNVFSELWYLACHFVLQYWDFSPEKVGQAVMGGGLDHVFANCRTGQVSLRAHKDKRTKVRHWPAILVSCCWCDLGNLFKDCVMVGGTSISCVKQASVSSSCLSCHTYLIASGNWVYQVSPISYVLSAWTTESSWKQRHHWRSSSFNFSLSPLLPHCEGFCSLQTSCLKNIFTASITLLNENTSLLLLSRDANYIVIMLRIHVCSLKNRTSVYSTHLSNNMTLFLSFALLPIYCNSL